MFISSLKKLLTLVPLLLFCYIGFAQQTSTPGGIPSSETLLRIWLESDDVKADMKTTTLPSSGSALTFWMDKSGNGINFSQPTTSKRPIYNSAIDGFPAVLFDDVFFGAKHTMNPVVSQTNLQKGSVYFVLRGKTSSSSEKRSNVIMEDKRNTGDGSLRFEQFNNTSKVGFTLYQVDDYKTTFNAPYSERSIISYRKEMSSSNITVKVKSGTENIDIGSNTRTIPLGSIGTNTNAAADYSNLYFHEIIIFDNALNVAQSRILENHLAAKYSGTTGSSLPIPTDYYAGDNSTNGNYDFDVIGIGQDAAITNSSLTAINSFGFNLYGLASFPNNTYIMMGHNDGNRTAGKSWITTTFSPSITSSQSFNRIWYVDIAGPSTDKVKVEFDFCKCKIFLYPFWGRL